MNLFSLKSSTVLRRKMRQMYDVPSFMCSFGPNILNWGTSLQPLSGETKHKIEKKWQRLVDQYHFDESDSRPKAYVLSMFPYPSGALHMGHVRVYTISDTIARYYRMNGYNVLHPMGWDAFGLPAENAAMEHGEDPASWTEKNIKQMKTQLKQLGCSFDWHHEITTCDASYYRWTQHIFLLMYKAGLVFRKPALVNWDPIDQTVLADEQVDEHGNSWRSGAKVEKVLLTQWFIKSTKFSKSLSDGLASLHRKDWQDIIKLQKMWIGNVNGFLFDWVVQGVQINLTLPIWTEFPENICKATFIAVSLGSILDKVEEGCSFREYHCNDVNGKPLTVRVRHLKAVASNPISKETVPVFVVEGLIPFSDGSDTYMGTPSITPGDKLFADLVGIPISSERDLSYVQKADADVRAAICEEAQRAGQGGYPCGVRLRDWLISRQRYWGTPIPIVYCDVCGTVPVPEEQLPVQLPAFPRERSKTGHMGSPLQDATDWVETTCPKCGGPGARETDTMDTFVDSAWYYWRFIDSNNNKAMFNQEKVKKFMPVDIYIGGKEHAVLHMYFARLISHFLHQEGLVPCSEPFRRLLVQGMIMGQSFREKHSGRYLRHDEVDMSNEIPCSRLTGEPVIVEWEKMSKSKHNGIDPAQVIQTHGADTTRLQILADVAPTSNRHWSSDGFQNTLKLQSALHNLVSRFIILREDAVKSHLHCDPCAKRFIEGEERALHARNKHLGMITFNYEVSYQLMVVLTRINAFIGDLRNMPDEVVTCGSNFERALATLLIVLAPMAPHFTSELWQGFASAPGRTIENCSLIQWDKPVLEQKWPKVDGPFEIPVTVEINNAEVCTAFIPHERLEALDADELLSEVMHHDVVKKVLQNQTPTIQHMSRQSGYKAKLSLKAPGIKVNIEDIDPQSKQAKKAFSKLKRRGKKSGTPEL